MLYRDRKDAGQQLAAALKKQGIDHPLVLGIPRGGIPVAVEVAQALDGELAVVVARKLGAPGYPELAIGAVTADGASYINSGVAVASGADQRYIDAERQRQIEVATRREELFDGHRRPPAKDRTVVIVDDGIATGATAIAAVRSMRGEGAARVILAVPVGPPETIELLQGEADIVVCLDADPGFGAVGQYYVDFSQVSDQEARAMLERFHAEPADNENRKSPQTERATIQRGEVSLVADLTRPAGTPPFPLVVFVHGFGSSKESPRNQVIAAHLLDRGIATLMFDLSGHGESTRDPNENIDAYVADLDAVYGWVLAQEDIDGKRIGISGSSLGGVIATRALIAGKVYPRTMVLRAPPMEPEEFRAIDVPSLLLVGSYDPLLSEVRAGAALNPELTLSVVEGASHLFGEPGALEEALARTVNWFEKALFEKPAREEGLSGELADARLRRR
jgi:predicted phosphoribosyltransferase/alpha-beta hydrolase superfamily lysophospholipase